MNGEQNRIEDYEVTSNTDDVMSQKLDYWKKRLIDLSKRNNLVSYRFTKSKSLKISSPGFDQALTDLQLEGNIRFLIEPKETDSERLWLCTEDEEVVSKKLYNLYLKARENFQELGISTCFVSLGMLYYKDSHDSEITRSAPIFLHSVEISRTTRPSSNYHRFEINSADGELQLNPALVEMLSRYYGIELEDFADDVPGYLDYLGNIVATIPGSCIELEVYVDIFSYQKYIMYEDLIRNEEFARSSDLVRVYVGEQDALQDDVPELMGEYYDDTTSPDVLPADSSQKRAIELAKAGITFVLQGPPGTGKSQTIVNIIAALIQQKKRVLFVSQKMAALNVVQKRLDQIGLGRYCLNLHTYRGSKKEIIGQLMHELQTSPSIPSEARRFSFSSYLGTQRELNDYYRFLGSKRQPWNLSVYELRGKIAKLHDVDDSKITIAFSNVLSFTQEALSALVNRLSRIQKILSVVGNPFDSWLYYFKREMNTTLARRRFNGLITAFRETLRAISEYADRLRDDVSADVGAVASLENIAEIEKVLAKVEAVPGFLLTGRFFEHSKAIASLHSKLVSISNLKRDILQKVSDDFLEDDLEAHKRVFLGTGFLNRAFRFSSVYRNSRRVMKSYAKGRISHGRWLVLFNQKEQLRSLSRKLAEFIEENGFNDLINNPTDIGRISELKQLCDMLEPAFKSAQRISENYSDIVSYCFHNKHHTVGGHLADTRSKIEALNEFLSGLSIEPKGNISSLLRKTEEAIGLLPHLNEILIFRDEFLSMDQEVQTFIADYLQSGTEGKIVDVFHKVYYLQALDSILLEENRLAPKDLVARLRNEDLSIRDQWHLKVMDTVQEEKPRRDFQSTGSSEVNILKRESQKKRRLKPVRRLLQEIPILVFRLKPCFMMSPLTVSQYIDPGCLQFDVVIFDEASQIMPEDAVPCLMRAKQAIVMGDTQQLPPTSFFSSQSDEFADDNIEDLESFLSEASVKFRENHLEWHYRSNYEELIAFSNRFFYGSRLVTFPNYASLSDKGLSFVYVEDGVYDRGRSRKNRVEAQKVVEVYRQLSKQNDKSIGIIAFSIAQDNAIREAFVMNGIQIEENIDPQVEELFIKNLETVQGDERDIIILSVGYGKDSQGRLSYNFGPLNKSNGYKRLNVAITRSRDKTVVVSSIHPHDLDDSRINAEGLRHLKNYLSFAVNKDFDKIIESAEHLGFDSSFEEAVFDALTAEGYDVSSQVGCSGYRIDLAVKHPQRKGEYILGVECDGAQYHSSRYARDRDKIRQAVLERLGWNIHRIWSDDWLNNRAYEIDKIKSKVGSLLESGGTAQVRDDQFTQVEEVNDFREVSLAQKYKSYKVAQLPFVSDTQLEFDNHGFLVRGKSTAMNLLLETLKVESPIEKDLLFRRVLAAFGITRLGARLRRSLEAILRYQAREHVFIYENTVSTKEIDGIANVRSSAENQRPFILIPKEELGGAVIDILEDTLSIEKEALVSDVSRVFGISRAGSRIQKKVNDVIEYLKRKNLIVEEDGRIRLSN